jgi:hypothetical protein
LSLRLKINGIIDEISNFWILNILEYHIGLGCLDIVSSYYTHMIGYHQYYLCFNVNDTFLATINNEKKQGWEEKKNSLSLMRERASNLAGKSRPTKECSNSHSAREDHNKRTFCTTCIFTYSLALTLLLLLAELLAHAICSTACMHHSSFH